MPSGISPAGRPTSTRMKRTFAAAAARRIRQEDSHEDLDRDGLPERHPGREARSHRRRQVRRASRSSRTTSSPSTARRPTCAAPARELGLDIVTLQPFRDFEGMPAGQRERAFARAERKFDVMQELGCDLLMICSNVSPEVAGRHRPRRRRPARAGRARRQARPAHRLRGAGLGPPHQRLPRRLGGGAPRRPSRGRAGARHLPHPGARHRPLRHPRHPAATASSWCSSPTRRCCRWTTCRGAGTSATSPARATCRSLDFMEALPATGYDGAAVAGDLQRPVPRRLGAQRRGRRPSLAALPARPAARADRQASPACRHAAALEVPRA